MAGTNMRYLPSYFVGFCIMSMQSAAGVEGNHLVPFGLDWIIAENQPCQLWNPYLISGETITWSGDCVQGKASGEGRWVWYTVDGENVYEGDMRAGKPHGRGSLASLDGSHYEGEWRDGMANGRGTYTWPDDHRYEGEWRNDKRHGGGTLTFPDGSHYESQWRDGIAYGRGNHTNVNGVVRTCLYRNGKVIDCQ